MDANNALEVIEQLVLSRQLSPIEQLIIRQSWIGKSYDEMAQDTNYSSNYLKMSGFDLWNHISNILGRKVTKKNIHLLLPLYLKEQKLQPEPDLSSSNIQIRPNRVADRVEFPNSSLSADSSFYINRPPIEELVSTEISKPGCVVRIKAPKKMGKNSLINQIINKAKVYQYETVYLDFQEADQAIFTNLEKFLRWFCTNISRQLNLSQKLDDYWDEDIGSKVSCKIYFQQYLLTKIETALVIVLNEVNCVFEHPHIASEFLPMLRYWHEIARTEDVWQKLRLVIAHSTEIYISLKMHQSPFNVGLSIKLPEFTTSQVQLLAACYQIESIGDEQIQQLMLMVGGHPYLINLAFYHLYVEKMTLQELLQNAPTIAGIYSDYLRGLLVTLHYSPGLAVYLRQVLNADEGMFLDAMSAYKLESMGLIRLDGNLASISCELYRLYFRQHLEDENLLTVLNVQKQNNIQLSPSALEHNYFKQYLETQWRQWVQQALPLSMIWCDIDYFKSYNRYHGFGAANTALQQISSAVCDCVKDQAAFIARHKDEEFVVLLPQTTSDTAATLAEKIRACVQALAIIVHTQTESESSNPTSILTMSLGVATVEPSSNLYPDVLITAAQQAMIQSKKLGRNRVSVEEKPIFN
jgi:diguanylate cyclase (GGDEF)-like protein